MFPATTIGDGSLDIISIDKKGFLSFNTREVDSFIHRDLTSPLEGFLSSYKFILSTLFSSTA